MLPMIKAKMQNKLLILVAALSAFVALTEAAAPNIDCAPRADNVFVGTVVKCTCKPIYHSRDLKATAWKVAGIRQSSGFSGPNDEGYTRTIIAADNGKVISCFHIYNDGGGVYEPAEVTVKAEVQSVELDSILISEITSTSAKFTWKAPYSVYTYSVSIIPTVDGARVEPNPVPRGTTMVTLKNLSPGTVYQVTIWAVASSALSMLSGPSKKSFQTPARMPKDEQSETLSTAGLAVAVTCLVIIIFLIVLIIIIFRRIDQSATRGGNDTHIPMSNMAFERDHQPRKTPTPVIGKSSEFKTWLLSKQVSEDTYELIQREGFHDPAMFALLKPDEVSRLAIKPMAQELLLKDIVESFNKGETPFQTSGTAGDELYDDVTNENINSELSSGSCK